MPRWNETIVTALQEEGYELNFHVDGKIDDPVDPDKGDGSKVKVEVKSKIDSKWIPLEDFLEDEADKSRHDYVRENVITLSRLFNQRVKAFMKNIVMAKNSPMCVHRYSYKVEFQNRCLQYLFSIEFYNSWKGCSACARCPMAEPSKA